MGAHAHAPSSVYERAPLADAAAGGRVMRPTIKPQNQKNRRGDDGPTRRNENPTH
jgi:hypothetical protein